MTRPPPPACHSACPTEPASWFLPQDSRQSRPPPPGMPDTSATVVPGTSEASRTAPVSGRSIKPLASPGAEPVQTGAPAGSECAEAIEYLLEHVLLGSLVGWSLPHHGDSALHGQVGDQHAHHTHRQRGVRREVGQRDLLLAEGENPPVLG